MKNHEIAVIGAGASGMVAAISAARKGRDVVILEKMPSAGKKLLATGAGRCNLLNDNIDESKYSGSTAGLVRSVFFRFGKKEIIGFFSGLGVILYSDCGRIFPVTNQAASVLRALQLEIDRLKVPVAYNHDVSGISHDGEFKIGTRAGAAVTARYVILTGGGKSYPAYGSDGSVYSLAGRFGHSVISPVPSAVPLVVKDRMCHYLQGQRITARAEGIVNGKTVSAGSGELLFTKYGLSGTAVIDASGPISAALNRNASKDVFLRVDMVPFMSFDELKAELETRMARHADMADLLVGILPNKFGPVVKAMLPAAGAEEAARFLKERSFRVNGTRGWNEAEFTLGGVDPSEIRDGTLESMKRGGLYLAGEVIDVGGKRGGYNLAWAWASGYVAGLTE